MDNKTDRAAVIIADEVDRTRIATDATIHAGCRLAGERTVIGAGAVIGQEAPVTLKNCYVGPQVRLKGGYFEDAVFLEGAEAGSGAHVRAGTILEEQARIAHTVGLKQTILFPFVTLGSLINFCDCLMAGGTSRKNHSEVGSSYIHFNYTPNQDKATASLIGDVPRGVMLDQAPIFLGGQGGLVGPCRIAYGTVIAAGSIYRKDQLKPDRLVFEGGGRGGSVPYSPGIYRNVKRQALSNILYLANLVALAVWYAHVRSQFIGRRLPRSLFDGLTLTLQAAIAERIKRFVDFCAKLPDSSERYRQQMGESAAAGLLAQKAELFDRRNQLADLVHSRLEGIQTYAEDPFPGRVAASIRQVGPSYLEVIGHLEPADRLLGTAWLQRIVDDLAGQMVGLLPALQ